MVATRLIFALVLSWAVMSTSTQIAQAQILRSPALSRDDDVRQADGNFDDAELSGGVKRVGWLGVPWPTITMPTITMPKMPSLWPAKSDSGSPSLTTPLTTGYSKVSTGTKKAWSGTKDLFSVFRSKDDTKQVPQRAQVPQSTSKPKLSFWQRLTTKKKQEPEVPQTVGEFMSLPRLGP